MDRWQECLSQPFHEVLTHAWSRICSGFCCSAVSACLSLPQLTCVDVAANRTPLATIAQRAPRRVVGQTGVRGGDCCRQHPTSWSAIWTCQRHGKRLMAEGWKLWSKAYQSSGACSWRSTRLWCVFSTATERLDVEHRQGTAWPSTQLVDARSGHSQNWSVHDPGPDWLSSRVKSEEVVRRNGHVLAPHSSQKLKPGQNILCCV